MDSGNPKEHDLEHVTGLIERVTFHSPESGFAVLRVKVRGHRDLVTVVGTLPNVSAGEWVDARGRWAIDPEHGQQFKAVTIRTSQPNTAEGMEKFLGSGLIKGIGPKFASRLVKAFGTEVFDIIENTPDRLTDVDGIGKVRQTRITTAWQEQKMVREIMVFLHGHGVGTSRAFRIYKAYGEDAIEKVQENPYRLVEDIWGIGFKTADQIAANLGIEKESDIRARAGVEYVLQKLTEEGHCAFPRDGLVGRAVEVLEIPAAIIEKAIDFAIVQERLVQHESLDRGELVYLASLDASERGLAQALVSLHRGGHPCPAIELPKAIQWVQRQMVFELAQGQQRALELSVSSKVMVITGGPGVGKTSVLKAIVMVLCAKKLDVVLCAPTGRAAKRMTEAIGMNAKTIHRLLEFDPVTGGFKHGRNTPLEGDVFILDEMSMVDLVLANQLVRAIPSNASLILVGDVDQLPSVGPGSVLHDIIDSGVIPVCRLVEVFRQAAQSAIVTNAHRINQGLMPKWPTGKVLKPTETDFYFVDVDEPPKAAEMIVYLAREKIPQRFGFDSLDDIQVLTPMQRGDLGARNLNQVLQAALNPAGEEVTRYGWTFRVGDKVMQIINNYDKDVFNGDIGRVVRIDQDEQQVFLRFDGMEVEYGFDELDELVLSYAATIHKSQGSEYPCVVVPIHTQHYMLLQRNLLYTAVTRGRNLVVLVGMKKAIAMATKRVDSRGRITTLRERLIECSDVRSRGEGMRHAQEAQENQREVPHHRDGRVG